MSSWMMRNLFLALLLLVPATSQPEGLGFVQRAAYEMRAKQPPTASTQTFGEVFCSQAPWLCSSTFDCLNSTGALPAEETLRARIATSSGQPNLQSWCYFQVRWDTIVKSCLVDQDLSLTARQLFHQALQAHPAGEDNDAQYCFLNGLCEEQGISPASTLEDATAVCDRRYPEPNGWKSIGFADPALQQPPTTVPLAETYAKSACAQGSFHCMAVYCQETYCKMDEYRQKFGQGTQETL
ncbi:unnamed protein product [Symbiodinium necroappetens]|nr:unnamed protein product [Symbiodinium necroappetens]|mmetsp:Transcript_98224/g.233776  ORF Transcript_98224/g.233776 Transcript_98224/m.233776 type:complete len:239 (-) Transcript_98224:69-785(-)